MLMTRQYVPLDDKTEAIALLSSMQSSLSEWRAMPPALEQSRMPCRLWRAQLYVVARHARSAGLHAHSSLSIRIGEQLEPWFRSHELPGWAVELLLHWSRASLRYLGQTTEPGHAAELAGLLDMSRSPECYGAEERASLLRNLIDDQESEAQLSPREAGGPGSRAAGAS
jgi:hypothetical protein